MPDQLTATVDVATASVNLKVEAFGASSTAALTAVVERSDDGGATWATVRGGNPLTLIGAPSPSTRFAYLVDTEMPLNTAVRYRASIYGSAGPATSVLPAGPVTVTVADGIAWLKDPARPWADLRVDDCTDTGAPAPCADPLAEPAISLVASGLGAEGYDGDFTLFPILNSARPADVYAYRKDAVTSWTLVSKTLASMTSLNVFYAWGGPILIQLPPVYGWADRYYQPGRVDVSRLGSDLRLPYRLWDVPLTVVNAPVGAAQGTIDNNWCTIDSLYGTYGGLLVTGLTWGDVQAGAAVPPDVTDGYGLGPYGDGPYGDGG